MKYSFGIAILLLSVSGPAIAQSNSEPARRNISLQASTRLLYDTNVFRSNPISTIPGSGGVGRGDDLRVSPSLDGNITLPVGARQSVFARGSVGYDFYTKNSRLNAERLDIEAGANLRFLNNCSTTVSGTYLRNRSDFADLLLDPRRFPNIEEISSLGANFQCDSAIGISPGASYRHTIADNKSSLLDRNDYRSDSFSADLGYSRPSFGRLSVYGTYTDTTFPRRELLTPGPQQDQDDGVKSYSAGVRFQRDIGSRIRGSVSIGHTWVRPRFGGAKFSGASYSLQADLQPTDRLALTVLASRSADVSNLLDINYSITERYSLGGTYALSPRVSLTFGASHEDRNFVQSTIILLPFARGGDKITQGYVGANYKWSDRLTLSADVTHEKRSSDIPVFDYKSTRVGVGVSLGI